MRAICLKTLILTASLVFASPAGAGEIEGVTFADEVRVADPSGSNAAEVRPRSMALLRYRVVFRGYVAALYLPADVKPEGVLDDVPRRLELSYFWSIGAEDFARAADQMFERSLSREEQKELRPRIDRLHAAYRDVAPGDRYALDYLPGSGTTLRFNGEPRVTIPGEDFARAYFGLWLGDPPLDESLRDALLRLEPGR